MHNRSDSIIAMIITDVGGARVSITMSCRVLVCHLSDKTKQRANIYF